MGMQWWVGNGKKIKIWDDKWLLTPSSYQVQSLVNMLTGTTRVKDLMDYRGWNSQLIKTIFWKEECQTILDIPLSFHIREDRLIWSLTDHGRFTVKSAYFALLGMKRESRGSTTHDAATLGLIFGLSIPENVKKFLWRLHTNSLPTKSNLYFRRIILDQSCPFCLHEIKFEIHLVWNCTMANDVWAVTDIPISKWPKTMESMLFLWKRLKILKQSNLERASIVLRYIWMRRNDFVFNKTMLLPNKVFLIANQIYELMVSSYWTGH